jgi:protein TonB
VPGGVPGGIPGGVPGGTLGAGSGNGTGAIMVSVGTLRVRFQPSGLTYPAMAKRARIQGTVLLTLHIGVDGVPIRAEVLDGPPALRDSAMDYAMRWRFEPYRVDGVAQIVKLPMSIPFTLR